MGSSAAQLTDLPWPFCNRKVQYDTLGTTRGYDKAGSYILSARKDISHKPGRIGPDFTIRYQIRENLEQTVDYFCCSLVAKNFVTSMAEHLDQAGTEQAVEGKNTSHLDRMFTLNHCAFAGLP